MKAERIETNENATRMIITEKKNLPGNVTSQEFGIRTVTGTMEDATSAAVRIRIRDVFARVKPWVKKRIIPSINKLRVQTASR